ncbi:hybrid sensor histidine kinase/response regulator [Candidatus Viadribacter manganicus]|nr:hybrid sensor histidine kinase/response regulator [Candidatus Viadribacter manganicus]
MSLDPDDKERRAIELALAQFNQRSWSDHFVARLAAIGVSSLFVAWLVSPQWGAFTAACAMVGFFWDAYATRTLHRAIAGFASFNLEQARAKRRAIIAIVTVGSAIYCLPYAALALAPEPGPILGMIFATGAMSLIIGQHVLTRSMSLWTLPTPTFALGANAMMLAGADAALGCAAFALIAAANAYTLAMAAWRASQDLIDAQLNAEYAAETLDQQVIVRTRELASAMAEAKAANEQKSAFLSAASHDLRQPLQAATAYMSVIESRAEADIGAIATKALTALDVTNDILGALLDVSRLNAGAVELRTRDFSADSFLARLKLQFETAAADKNLDFICSFSPLMLHCDPDMLERIVANYLSNAIRYTQAGAVELSCSRRGHVARLQVRDTGIGIAADKLDAIFDEFVQLNNLARSRTHGYGLGLSVAKRIGALINCATGVESKLGEGSTFWVDVPITDTAPRPLELAASEAPARKFTHVLLIEDDEMVASATNLALENEGYKPKHVMSAKAALLALAHGYRPDVIISDFRLPDGYGADLINTLRLKTASPIPSLLLTGDTVLGDAEAERAGIPILHKPVPARVLFEALSKLKAAPSP